MSPNAAPPIPRHWRDATWRDIAAAPADRVIAVLPVGATEQHGPHLPLSVDHDLAAAIAQRGLAATPASVAATALPVQPIGLSEEHTAYPGTLTVDAETLTALWTQIGASVARAGVRKLLILNAHGGQNQVMDSVCSRLRRQHGMLAVGLHWPKLGIPDGLIDSQELRHGIHAGAVETAMMQALRPETVRTAELATFTPASVALETRNTVLSYHGAAKLAWQAEDLHPSGAVGDARQACPETGEAILTHVASAVAQLLVEMDAMPPPGGEAPG